jgi:hypothetical protein
MFCTLFLCLCLPAILVPLQPSFECRRIDSDAPVDMVFVQPERLIRIQLSPGQSSIYLFLIALGAGTLYIVLCIVGR